MSVHNTSVLNDTGILQLEGASVVIVYTEWNEFIINELLAGSDRILAKHNITSVVKIQVPGAVEIPFAIKQYWEETKGTSKQPSSFIAFGCVIRGGTPHFDYVCKAITEGVTQLNLTLPVPTIFGVLTVNNVEQAEERLGGIHGHKGEEAALAALKMMSFQRQLVSGKL
ncbi:6,7-dimethyl-8-ribityllumazine synthase [Chitinophaga skermanii]|uniref:6,7-dimethyl-8-ribityllumazine synthase n=1 Tax=Chitinophaga skermanii TaxID=331697 RepID=A0A327QT38_9BACT|nr:6,7-dimethyl-8-ribityllumazine synthase [Chitinophaga skermanii]RAJ06804.1 6,7-dimethyl-8-ribityllumazine synthase [Chitinophaga skermanii]